MSHDTEEYLRAAMDALGAIRVPAQIEERALHEMVARALDEAGLVYRHEAPIAPRCRVDFLLGDVGIEVKRERLPAKKLNAQISRYLESDHLNALLLVTTRGAHVSSTLRGKRVEVFGLSRLWGVSLP